MMSYTLRRMVMLPMTLGDLG